MEKIFKEKIYIGSDHAGFELKKAIKKFLIEKNYEVKDLGPFKFDHNDDYPDYAVKVCREVLKNRAKGILICATGQGMDRAANKHKGIYAEVCWNKETARHAKEHSNANVLCFGQKTISEELAKEMVKIWLETEFKAEERHVRRANKVKKISNTNAL